MLIGIVLAVALASASSSGATDAGGARSPVPALSSSGAADRAPRCATPVADVYWTGSSLAVTPSACGRRLGATRPARVLDAALAAAGAPVAASRSLRGQLRCHAVFARTKTTWYLEPARPAVSWLGLIAAGCNP